jgi:hypothetical protein
MRFLLTKLALFHCSAPQKPAMYEEALRSIDDTERIDYYGDQTLYITKTDDVCCRPCGWPARMHMASTLLLTKLAV